MARAANTQRHDCDSAAWKSPSRLLEATGTLAARPVGRLADLIRPAARLLTIILYLSVAQAPGAEPVSPQIHRGESATSTSSSVKPQYWIATVSVNRYWNLPESAGLRHCDADARSFVECMRLGNSIPQDNILEMNDGSEFPPSRTSILEQLPKFLSRAMDQDVVMLYFAMHGVQHGRNAAGAYLVPCDVEPARVPETLIDLKWLREILTQSVRAKKILVFLDVCHSGGIAVNDSSSLARPSTRSMKVVFEDAAANQKGKLIYVLTSCDENEASVEDPVLKHGVFTYWLLNGLKGAADQNGDASITMDELFQFVALRVPRTARQVATYGSRPFPQNPQRFFCGRVQGDVKVLDLPARGVSESLLDTSNLIHRLVSEHFQGQREQDRLSKVSVLEFGTKVGDRHQLRGALGSFGKISRELVERRLVDFSTSGTTTALYGIAGQAAAEAQLRNINLKQLVSGEWTGIASPEASGIDVIVTGQYLRRGHTASDPGVDRLQLEVSVLDLRQGVHIARFSQTILVNAELWSLLGDSYDSEQAAKQGRPQGPAPEAFADSLASTAKPSTPPVHPLRDPARSALRVEVFQSAGSTAREAKQRVHWLPATDENLNQLAFETDEGHELELRLTNQIDRPLAVIVQIDGVNQIGRTIELPRHSWYWTILPGATKRIDQWLDDPSTKYAREGFDLRGTKLVVTNPPSSLAGQLGYWDQLGEIRVLVYELSQGASTRDSGAGKPALGVGEGAEVVNRFVPREDAQIDLRRNVAKYVIRYRKFANQAGETPIR